MILKALFFVSLSTIALPGLSQQNDGTAQSSSIYGDGFNARVQEIPFTPGETEGSHYLFSHWSPGTIAMRNGEAVRDVFLKYDVQKNALSIKTDSAYYVLPTADTKGFTIFDNERNNFRQFVAAKDYQLDGVPLVGALEVLYDGHLSLLSRTDSKLIEANYSGALSGGSKNNKIVKEREYFLADKEKLLALPTKKREAIDVLQTYDKNVEGFMKEKRLKPKREADLVQLIEYLNQKKR